MFIVPLNALIQFHARDDQLGTVLAGNNWVQNVVMLGFLGLTVFFAIYGISSIGLFQSADHHGTGRRPLYVYQLPQSLVRYVIARVFSSTHRITGAGF